MTDETVDCFNCGRANPEWAQVCRSCGVPLRHGQARVAPTGRIPTDQASLISIGAVVGTILLAVFLGLIVANLNPTDPTVGQTTPSPSVEPSVAPSVAPSEPLPSETPVPATPAPTPALPGTIAFGSELDANHAVASPVETFTPGVAFAYSVQMPGGFGQNAIENEIAKLEEGGETIVLPRQSVGVDPAATSFGYVIGTAGDFLGGWGPGDFEWRVYVGGELVARGTFKYAEG
jgi:hypothetical protein